MKKILFLLLITAISGSYLYGQTENVGINTTSPDNSAALHVTYVTTPKGILIPRMTTTNRDLISGPANGLLIFNTTTNRFEFYDSGAAAWKGIFTSGSLTPSEMVSTNASGNLQTFTFSQDLNSTPAGVATVTGLQGNDVSVTNPTNGQVLQWSTANTQWEPTTPASGGSGNTLDGAYDNGGVGAGRTITADAGAVQLTGSNAADETIEITTSGNGGLALLENTGTGNTLTINDEASDTTPFTIDEDGQVGVMTTTPTAAFDVDSTFKLGSDGSILKYVIMDTVSTNIPIIGASSSTSRNVTVNGARQGATVSVSPANFLGTDIVIAYARVTADDNVQITFVNVRPTATSAISSTDFYVTVIN